MMHSCPRHRVLHQGSIAGLTSLAASTCGAGQACFWARKDEQWLKAPSSKDPMYMQCFMCTAASSASRCSAVSKLIMNRGHAR